MKLIHLTDPHLVAPGSSLYGLDPLARFEAAIDDINRHHADAELCIISGDLADRADPAAYQALRIALERLLVPAHLIIGNHDDRSVCRAYFPDLPSDPDGFVQYRVETSAGNFFFLDTVEAGTHAGSYCERRRTWLRTQLSEHRDRNAYLVAHHPAFAIGIPSMDAISINADDAAATKALLSEFDQLKHLFFGHVHRPISGVWRNIGFSTLRSTCHQVWLDFTSTEYIPGSYEPPAYAVVLIDEDSIIVHNHDYLDASEKFPLGSWRWEAWHADRLRQQSTDMEAENA